MELLVDFYNLEENGNWSGSTRDCYASATANLCNIEPFYLKFTPVGIYTTEWLKEEFFGHKISISVDSFATYLTNELINYTMPVLQIEWNVDYTGVLNMQIDLSNNDKIGVSFGRIQ